MQQEINKENYKRYYFYLIGSFWVDKKIKLVTKENKESKLILPDGRSVRPAVVLMTDGEEDNKRAGEFLSTTKEFMEFGFVDFNYDCRNFKNCNDPPSYDEENFGFGNKYKFKVHGKVWVDKKNKPDKCIDDIEFQHFILPDNTLVDLSIGLHVEGLGSYSLWEPGKKCLTVTTEILSISREFINIGFNHFEYDVLRFV